MKTINEYWPIIVGVVAVCVSYGALQMQAVSLTRDVERLTESNTALLIAVEGLKTRMEFLARPED